MKALVPTGRFAPSPTGPLHIGSMMAAIASYLDARAARGRWLVRIEDIDPPREQPGAADGILRTLEACSLTWDGDVVRQSWRTQHYRDALTRLADAGHVFYCDCSRTRIASQAARAADGGFIYPGTCRDRKTPASGPTAVRLDTSFDGKVSFDDRLQGRIREDVATSTGDFVLLRRDGLFAYHLAVAVDDAAQGVTDIVRGIDLLSCTPSQLLVQRALGLPQPRYAHIPIAVNAAGQKLSKQTGAAAVQENAAARTVTEVLSALQHSPPPELRFAPAREQLDWAVAAWTPERLKGQREWPAPSAHG